MHQWIKRLEQFVPEARVGIVQQDKTEIEDKDVVVAMLHSLVMRDYDRDLMHSFGLIIFDEAHHLAARTFSKIFNKIPSRYVLGLTATPKRKDGLTRLLHWTMGPTVFERSRVFEEVWVDQVTYSPPIPFKEVLLRNKKPNRSRMISNIAKSQDRTRAILPVLLRAYDQGRYILILSDRREHLEDIYGLLVASLARDGQMGYYVGGMKQADREVSETKRIILSTFSMAREGLDIPRLDTLFMVTPQGDIEQSVGRILRTHPDKQTPLVIEMVDPFSVFRHCAYAHRRYYQDLGWPMRRYTTGQDPTHIVRLGKESDSAGGATSHNRTIFDFILPEGDAPSDIT